jgi:hypothetical protein
VELAHLQFEHHALAQAVVEEISPRTRRPAKIRSIVALGLFLTAMLVSFKFLQWSFALVCCALLLYLRPEPPVFRRESTAPVSPRSRVTISTSPVRNHIKNVKEKSL